MELDQQTITALAIGGVALIAALNFFARFNSSKSEPVKVKEVAFEDTKPKSSKSKKKRRSRKSRSKEPEPEKPKPKPKKVEVKAKVEKTPVKPAETKSAKKKKKRNRKKKKVKNDSLGFEVVDSSDEEISTQKAKRVEKPVEKSAADFYNADVAKENEDGGWETVPVKVRKPGLKSTVIKQTTVNGTKGKKKEIRQVLSIGDHVAVVLGEGGNTISNIQNVSGAKVSVNKGAKTCAISGDEESVAVAVQLVESLVSNQSKHVISVATKLDKAIISRAETKQSIREISGAKLDFKYGEGRDDPLTVIITGESEKVDHARILVEQCLEGKNPQGGDGVRRVRVSPFQGRILIGQKGSQINKLQKQTGCTINIDFEDDVALVSVIGDEKQINEALEAIRVFLVEHNVKANVDLDPDARGVLPKLNELKKEIPNLQIELSKDRAQIMLSGSKQGVTKGSELLLKWIEKELGPPEARPGEILEAVELGNAAGKVIGRQRSTLNSIEKDCKGARAEIKRGTTCYIVGKKEAVAKAVSAIKEIIDKHNQTIEKAQKERARLQEASWTVDSSNDSAIARKQVASLNDWGGFNLAQAQGW